MARVMELRRDSPVNNVSHVFFSFHSLYIEQGFYICAGEKSPVVVRPFMVRQACSEGVSAAIFQAEGFFGILKTIRGDCGC